MKITQQQFEAVLKLPGAKRYAHFVKVAADQRQVWGLFSAGWALATTNEGKKVFPVWPALEYAKACAVEQWAGFEARPIDLDTLFQNLLPKLAETSTAIGVFPTPQEKGVTPDSKQFEEDIRTELARIE